MPKPSPPITKVARSAFVYSKVTARCAVTLSPVKGGTRSGRNLLAMHSASGVPANAVPRTVAILTSPVGKNVADTRAVPIGLSAVRHEAARLAPRFIARAISFSVASWASASGTALAGVAGRGTSIGGADWARTSTGAAACVAVAGAAVAAAIGSGHTGGFAVAAATRRALERPTAKPTAAAVSTDTIAIFHCPTDGRYSRQASMPRGSKDAIFGTPSGGVGESDSTMGGGTSDVPDGGRSGVRTSFVEGSRGGGSEGSLGGLGG